MLRVSHLSMNESGSSSFVLKFQVRLLMSSDLVLAIESSPPNTDHIFHIHYSNNVIKKPSISISTEMFLHLP